MIGSLFSLFEFDVYSLSRDRLNLPVFWSVFLTAPLPVPLKGLTPTTDLILFLSFQIVRSFFSKDLFYRFEIAHAEFFIRFKVTSLGPFVPGVDRHQFWPKRTVIHKFLCLAQSMTERLR
jgi:hypothetical protein